MASSAGERCGARGVVKSVRRRLRLSAATFRRSEERSEVPTEVLSLHMHLPCLILGAPRLGTDIPPFPSLARRSMSGLKSYELNASSSLKSCLELTPHTDSARYARNFATKGYYDSADYDTLSKSIGSTRASSVRGLSWFLKWGAYGGNTIITSLSPPTPFKLLFTLYYVPLYAIIKVFSLLLKVFPTGTTPKVVSQGIGVLLPAIGGCWILPLGVLGGMGKMLGLVE